MSSPLHPLLASRLGARAHTSAQGSSPAAYRPKAAPGQAPPAEEPSVHGGPGTGTGAAAAGGPAPLSPQRPLARRQGIANFRPLYSVYVPSDHYAATPVLDIPGAEGRPGTTDLMAVASLPNYASPGVAMPYPTLA